MGDRPDQNMRNTLIVALILGLCLVGGLTWFGDEQAGMPPGDLPVPVEAGAGTSLPEPIELQVQPAPEPTQVPAASGSLRLPDGTYLPALNGVREDLELNWPRHLPFSPVVGRVTDSQGIERYLHADGSQSTTQMVYRSDLGRDDAAVLVSTPRPAVPTKQGSRRRR